MSTHNDYPQTGAPTPSIVVFGSINLDICMRTKHLPATGETVLGGEALLAPGGKGANQAHAARRWGARVSLFGAVGQDGFAAAALAQLIHSGVNLDGVARVASHNTGLAAITVDARGENTIVVAAGANAAASAAQVPDEALKNAAALLLQLESPCSESFRLARRARQHGCRVILNASPLSTASTLDLGAIDLVIVNQLELAQLGQHFCLNEPDTDDSARLAAAIASLRQIDVLVTLGAAGALLASRQGDIIRAGTLPIQVIDSTGAGDTFAGVFAAASASSENAENAMLQACAAAALACTGPGAQTAQPWRSTVMQHLRSQS